MILYATLHKFVHWCNTTECFFYLYIKQRFLVAIVLCGFKHKILNVKSALFFVKIWTKYAKSELQKATRHTISLYIVF